MKTSSLGMATVLLAIMLTGGTWIFPQASMAAECAEQGELGVAQSCNKQLSWSYNPQTKSFESAGLNTSQGDPTGVKYAYQSYPVCDGGQTAASCGAATFTCPALTSGGPTGHRVGVIRWLLLPDGTKTPGPGESSTACDYPSRAVPVVDVEALARQQIEKAVSHPKITVAPPGGKTLVNIPTIFSAPDPKPVTLTITAPVPGTITAIPEYTWDFGDGLTGEGAGTPYDALVDPMKHPDNYLHAVYLKGGPKHITATLTWKVAFSLEGSNPVDLAPIVFTSATDIRVMTARARLYKS
jgi:hypothetical protein